MMKISIEEFCSVAKIFSEGEVKNHLTGPKCAAKIKKVKEIETAISICFFPSI